MILCSSSICHFQNAVVHYTTSSQFWKFRYQYDHFILSPWLCFRHISTLVSITQLIRWRVSSMESPSKVLIILEDILALGPGMPLQCSTSTPAVEIYQECCFWWVAELLKIPVLPIERYDTVFKSIFANIEKFWYPKLLMFDSASNCCKLDNTTLIIQQVQILACR